MSLHTNIEDSKAPELLLNEVMSTSFLVAHCRYLETKSPHPLVHDPYSIQVAQYVQEKYPDHFSRLVDLKDHYPNPTNTWKGIAIRTKWIDDHILDITSRYPQSQLVIMGVGLDGREYRMNLPHTKMFQIDQEAVIQTRKQINPLSNSNVCTLSFDFNQPLPGLKEQLLQEGYDPEIPSIWIAEGLLMYLSNPSIVRLFDFMNQCNARHIVSMHYTKEAFDLCKTIPVVNSACSYMEDWLQPFFQSLGYKMNEFVALRGKKCHYNLIEDPFEDIFEWNSLWKQFDIINPQKASALFWIEKKEV